MDAPGPPVRVDPIQTKEVATETSDRVNDADDKCNKAAPHFTRGC